MFAEPGEVTSPLSLDVVRARIFYLACDVEVACPPAAMLLRAIADAIDEGGSAGTLVDAANTNGALATLLSRAPAIRAANGAEPKDHPMKAAAFRQDSEC